MTQDMDHLRTVANVDGAAVLDMNRGTISTLNATGAYIWQALRRGECQEDIVDDLAAVTGQPAEAIRQDVGTFIEHLQKQGLWRRSEREHDISDD